MRLMLSWKKAKLYEYLVILQGCRCPAAGVEEELLVLPLGRWASELEGALSAFALW